MKKLGWSNTAFWTQE